MREIKFRAFNSQTKEMFDVDVLALRECAWDCSSKRGVSIPYQPSIKIMQFTGLKDKNGVEIYEGDIITYDNSGYCFKVEYEAPEFVRHTTNYDLRNQSVPFKSQHAYEVIGNIHENPELLNG